MACHLPAYSKRNIMRTYYHPNETDSKAAGNLSEEDPPNNLTKQNDAGANK